MYKWYRIRYDNAWLQLITFKTMNMWGYIRACKDTHKYILPRALWYDDEDIK